MTIQARFRLERAPFTLDADLSAPGQGVTAIFGPSGSGKTSLLRCMAGLERAPNGRFTINGACWQDEEQGHFLVAHRRPLGYVFQEASLFPHLSVRSNIAYGWRRIAESNRRVTVAEAAELAGAGALLPRWPQQLSGGQRQRVAIARALATSPQLLLMDEPLAGIDRSSKTEILANLEAIQEALALPILYVSHTLDEVIRLADYLVLLEAGRVRAAGPVAEIITRLDLPFAYEPQAAAVIEAQVADHDEAFQLTHLDFTGGRLSVSRQPARLGTSLRIGIHARDVSLTLELPQQTSILNVLPVRVLEIAEANPTQLLVRLDAGGTPLLASITRKSGALLGLQPGMVAYAQVKSIAL